jgi:hypothetical protein
MEITPQLAVYVLLLVPGLLGHAIFCAFTYTAHPSWSGRIVVAILLSALSYTSLALLRTWDFMKWLPDPVVLLNAAEKGLAATVSLHSLACVFFACLLSGLFTILIVASYNHRTLFRIAQNIGLTTKSGFESEWDSAIMLRARHCWVMVLMKDGSAFTGWVESHDVASADRALVLSKIREYDASGSNFEWPPDELLFMNNLADVRALRLIPHREPNHEYTNAPQVVAATAQDRDQISKHESEPGPEGPTARLADQTREIAGQGEVTGNTTTIRESEHD